MCTLKITKAMVLGISILFITSMLTTTSHTKIDKDSIVGLWLLDDIEDNEAEDSSGNGHNGAIKGNPIPDDGKFGESLTFNGSGDYVDCGNADALNLGIFTVSFWAKFPASQGWNHMVSKGDHVASGTPGSVNWGVMMRSGEARFLYEIFEDVKWVGISAPAVPVDEWQHLTATYDGDKMELFLNGISMGASAGVKVKLDATRSFLIGARSSAGGGASHFNGNLDEVALFSEVLPLEDIQALMNDGIVETIQIFAVSPAGKAAATWAEIKAQY
ncbi:LamG domain-containing protein [Candidatus Poribacteria bacterium]